MAVIGAFENPDVVIVLSAEITDPAVGQRDGLGVAAFSEIARTEVVDAGGFVRDFPNRHLEGGGVFWSGVDEAAVAGQQASEVGHLGLSQTNAQGVNVGVGGVRHAVGGNVVGEVDAEALGLQTIDREIKNTRYRGTTLWARKRRRKKDGVLGIPVDRIQACSWVVGIKDHGVCARVAREVECKGSCQKGQKAEGGFHKLAGGLGFESRFRGLSLNRANIIAPANYGSSNNFINIIIYAFNIS